MQRNALLAGLLIPIALVVVTSAWFGGNWLWGELDAYVRPDNATERKELVNIFVLIAAGVIGALTATAALGSLYVSRKNLQNAQAALRQQRELDLTRRSDEALQAYFEQFSDLLVDKGLLEAVHPYSKMRVTARAQTLAVLPQLDGNLKKSVMQFLYEAQLINKNKKFLSGIEFEPRIVGLAGADLRNADLRYLTLEQAALDGVILENADLRDTRLREIDLGGSYLSGADLRRADLSGANLVNAMLQPRKELNLNGADLSGADLSGALVTDEQLFQTSYLTGATTPNGERYEEAQRQRGHWVGWGERRFFIMAQNALPRSPISGQSADQLRLMRVLRSPNPGSSRITPVL